MRELLHALDTKKYKSTVITLIALSMSQLLSLLLCFIFSSIVCGSEVNSTLKSPGYPNNYQNNMDCVYLIPIPQGTTMNISFDDFDIEADKVCG